MPKPINNPLRDINNARLLPRDSSRRLSPIELMIDKACGYTPEAQRKATPTEEDLAHQAAGEIIHHIDTMYPVMWQGVGKCARTSIRNTAFYAVLSAINAIIYENQRAPTPIYKKALIIDGKG